MNAPAMPASKKRTNLAMLVDPLIIRLNEGKHTGVVAEHGPSSPNHDNY